MDTKLTVEPGKVAGVQFELGGQKYIIPALNIEGVELHDESIRQVQSDQSMTLKDKTGLICRIALTAAQRNYPELDLAFMRRWIDMRNMLPIFQAILGQSGYTEQQTGEETGV